MTIEGVRTRVSTNEVLVTLAVPLEHAGLVSTIMAKVGCQVACAFADVERVEPQTRGPVPAPKKQFGQEAKALKMSGFFTHPDVLRPLVGQDALARDDVAQLGWDALKKTLGAESMADVDPHHVWQWARFFNVERYLPHEYQATGDA